VGQITTPLLPASMMQTAGISANDSRLVGCWPRIWAAMLVAATWAMVSAGNPVLGTPTGLAVCHAHGGADPDRVDVRKPLVW
jgi:hypothetical protein